MLPFLSDIRRAIAGNTAGSLWWDKTDKAMKQKSGDATKHSCIDKLTDFIPQTYCVVKLNCLPPKMASNPTTYVAVGCNGACSVYMLSWLNSFSP